MAGCEVYPDIPMPWTNSYSEDSAENLNAVRRAIEVIAQNLEAITGSTASRGGNTLPAATTGTAARVWCYRKTDPKEVDPVGLYDGDQWLQPPIKPTDTWIHLVWYKGQWIAKT